MFAFMKRDFTWHRRTTAGMFLALSLIVSLSCTRYPRLNSEKASPQNISTSKAAVNLNQASPSELEKLPGLGRALAERIVEHRNKYGPFRRVEHLLMVRGISESRFLELRPLLSIE
jgi:competence ComEA-like helix-hairpin-helix protein